MTTNTTLEVIDVEPDKRYRMRLINAFCTVCPGMFTIQDHKITIIATDGLDIEPKTVDSVTSFAGIALLSFHQFSSCRSSHAIDLICNVLQANELLLLSKQATIVEIHFDVKPNS